VKDYATVHTVVVRWCYSTLIRSTMTFLSVVY